MKELSIKNVIEAVKENSYVELVEDIEVEENLYLNCIVEGTDIIIKYRDYNNHTTGGCILEYEDIKNLTQKEFNTVLDKIYYYSCTIPMIEEEVK